MLIEIHLFLTIIAYTLLVFGLSLKKTDKVTSQEVQGNIPLLIFAMILFFFLSYTSLDLEYQSCHNQISWMNTTDENYTSLTNNVSCQTTPLTYTSLSNVYLGSGILSLLFAIFYGLNILRPRPQ